MRNASRKDWHRFYLSSITIGLSALFVVSAAAQSITPESVSADPLPLVRLAVANELKPGSHLHPYRYKLQKLDNGKSNTKEIVETRDGDVARLVQWGNNPLPADANQTEVDRLNNLLAHPEIQEHRRKREQADSSRADEMIRLLPNAFLYRYEGTAEGPSGMVYRLSLKPNPSFNPPDREAEVYAGMAGELWIDQNQERMVKLDVHLIADVNFGWGILGKLYKGGSILVEQKDVGNDHWEQFHFKLNLQGKALLVKSLNFDTVEDESDYQQVPADWGYQDAVKFLLSMKPGDIKPGDSGTAQASQR